MCLSSEVEASRPRGPLHRTSTSSTHLPTCRCNACLAQPQEVSSSVEQATARHRYVLHCYLPIICHCGSTLRSFLLTCYVWTTVFEDIDDFHPHDDRQPTPSRETNSPEPDVGRVRKGRRETCAPRGGALPPGFNFEFVRRSSHSRKRDPGHIPRPPNAFMLFRSDFWAKEKNKLTVERDHRMISRIAGLEWNKLSEAQRAPYRNMAELAKERHAQVYPNYKYTPVFRKERSSSRSRKGAKRAGVARASPEDYEAEWPKPEDNEDDRPACASRLRKPISRAKKSRISSRPLTPKTRSPSPESSVLEADHIKSEPSTPELTFSPEPAKTEIEDSPYLPSRGLVRSLWLNRLSNAHFCLQASDGTQLNSQVLPSPLVGLPFSFKRWDDDPPSMLIFDYVPGGDSFISDPFSDATVPVNVSGFQGGYSGSSESVDDAFAISPMFNPVQSFSFTEL